MNAHTMPPLNAPSCTCALRVSPHGGVAFDVHDVRTYVNAVNRDATTYRHRVASQELSSTLQLSDGEDGLVASACELHPGDQLTEDTDSGPLCTVERLIGSGAFGEVYEVTMADLSHAGIRVGEILAMKRVVLTRDQRRKRLVQLAEEAIRGLDVSYPPHPNVLRCRYVTPWCNQLSNDLLYFMEYVNGGDLTSFIHDGDVYKHDDVQQILLRLFVEIVDGVHHIHRKGIIHQDIKPDNILITCDGWHVKICDLGVSTKSLNQQEEEEITYDVWMHVGEYNGELMCRSRWIRRWHMRSFVLRDGVMYEQMLNGVVRRSIRVEHVDTGSGNDMVLVVRGVNTSSKEQEQWHLKASTIEEANTWRHEVQQHVEYVLHEGLWYVRDQIRVRGCHVTRLSNDVSLDVLYCGLDEVNLVPPAECSVLLYPLNSSSEGAWRIGCDDMETQQRIVSSVNMSTSALRVPCGGCTRAYRSPSVGRVFERVVTMTSTGHQMTTREEVNRYIGDVSVECDWWSVGLVMLELYAGRCACVEDIHSPIHWGRGYGEYGMESVLECDNSRLLHTSCVSEWITQRVVPYLQEGGYGDSTDDRVKLICNVLMDMDVDTLLLCGGDISGEGSGRLRDGVISKLCENPSISNQRSMLGIRNDVLLLLSRDVLGVVMPDDVRDVIVRYCLREERDCAGMPLLLLLLLLLLLQ